MALALALLPEVVVGRVTAVEWRGAIVAKLAARYGDRSGRGVHFTEASVRYLWLDRARRAERAAATANSGP